MLSPADIRPAVEAVLRAASSDLTTYEILDQLPAPLRQQIIDERGMPGLGSGNSYSAASLVTDAIEGLLPSLEPPYRVYVHGQAVFTVAELEIRPGNNAIALYRLNPPQTTEPLASKDTVESIATTAKTSSLQSTAQPAKQKWFEKPGILVLWLVIFWPVSLIGMYYNGKAAITGERTPWFEKTLWLVSSAFFSVLFYGLFFTLFSSRGDTHFSQTAPSPLVIVVVSLPPFFFCLFLLGLFNNRKVLPKWKWTIAVIFVLLNGAVNPSVYSSKMTNSAPAENRQDVSSLSSMAAVAPSLSAASQVHSERPQKPFLVVTPASGKKVWVKGALPSSGDTEVLITVSEKSSGSNLSAFEGQDKPALNHGMFSSGPFGGDKGLKPGYYTVEAQHGDKAMKCAFQLHKDGKVTMNSTPSPDAGYGVEFLSYLGVDEYNPEMVRKLLRRHPQLVHSRTDTGQTPLLFLAAGQPGDTEKIEAERLSIAKSLLQSGARVDERDSSGRTALCWAASMDDYQLVKFLLEQGANPNKMGSDMITPYDLAGDNDRIKSLLKQRGGMSYGEILHIWEDKDPDRRQQFFRSLSEDN